LGIFPKPKDGQQVIPMIKRHEVQVLLGSGLSHRQVSKRTGVSKRTVTRIAQETPIERLQPEAGPRRIGRPSTVHRYEQLIETILAERQDLPSVEILHRLRQAGYGGGKSAVYELVRARRGPAPSPLMVRFEGVAGEFAQFDFGEVRVRYTSGESQHIHFAAYRLKYSRWVYVEVVPNQQVEALARALLRAFEGSGGTPLSVVFDNPTTVVIHPKQTPIVWNPTVAQLAVDYAFAIELCTPRAANQKGAVENLVGWVKGSFFKVRRFADFADLLQQLDEWLTEVNTVRPCRATREIPAVLLAQEQQRLRPLAIQPADYGLRFDIIVGPTGMVTHKGIRYAMPAEAIGIPGTLHLYPDRVRIAAARHEMTHPRFPDRNLSYPQEVRAQHLAAVSGKRGRLYFQRQRLLELGPIAVNFITELVHVRPRTWKGDVEALYELLGRLGEEEFLHCLQNALLRGLIGAEYVTDLASVRPA
jgi:transposase